MLAVVENITYSACSCGYGRAKFHMTSCKGSLASDKNYTVGFS